MPLAQIRRQVRWRPEEDGSDVALRLDAVGICVAAPVEAGVHYRDAWILGGLGVRGADNCPHPSAICEHRSSVPLLSATGWWSGDVNSGLKSVPRLHRSIVAALAFQSSAAEVSLIFLSYAREDAGLTDGPDILFRALASSLGEGAVFLDKRSIVAGAEWEVSIAQALGSSRCLVLLFGERWRDVTVPRLIAPGEVLRKEIATARKAGIRIMPVFFGRMPRRFDLPQSLEFLREVHWERLEVEPEVADAEAVALRIIRAVAVGDVEKLVGNRPDPLVSGIAHLAALGPGLRASVAAALESMTDPEPSQVLARELVAIVRSASDGVAPGVVRSELLQPLRMCLDLDPARSEPATLRAVRAAIRPLLVPGRGSTGPLDREMLRVIDVVLSRSLAIRTGDGVRDSSGLIEAGDFLAAQPKAVRRLHRTARAFVADELLVGLDVQTRTAIVDLRLLDRVRSRPGPATGRVRVNHGRSGAKRRRR